jgi:hypothetical protein
VCVCVFRYIEERPFRRFVEACIEETIVVYVDHLLSQVYRLHLVFKLVKSISDSVQISSNLLYCTLNVHIWRDFK